MILEPLGIFLHYRTIISKKSDWFIEIFRETGPVNNYRNC